MMFTELSTPLGSDKCFPCPLIGMCVRMTDFSSDPLLESESCAFLLWNDRRFMCIELHKTLLFFLFSFLKWTFQSVRCLWEVWRMKVSINFSSNNSIFISLCLWSQKWCIDAAQAVNVSLPFCLSLWLALHKAHSSLDFCGSVHQYVFIHSWNEHTQMGHLQQYIATHT